MINGSRSEALPIIRSVLAADCACGEQAFLEEGVVVTQAKEMPGRRRFPFQPRPLLIFTMGAGVVISSNTERVAWLRANLGSRQRGEIFSATTIVELARYVEGDQQFLAGPDLKHVCTQDDFRPAAAPADIAITLVEGDAVVELYQYQGFREALHYRRDHERPDMAATIATRAGKVVGIAGTSADSETMWQIGVEVASSARGRGIGRALVSRLTEAVLDIGRIPYYSTTVSNIRSRALASSLGYWPSWTELYARDR